MPKYSRPILAVLMAIVALGACGKDDKKGDDKAAPPSTAPASAQGPLSGDAPVDISNFEFKPQKVTVRAGTKVTWTNRDTAIHDIKDTSPLNNPQGKEMSKGDTFSITYAQPGTYSYICGIHQYMTGSVEVVP